MKRTKIRLIAPLLGVSFAFILALTLLAGYGRPLIALKIAGSFNVGYLLIATAYVLCWSVAVIYVGVANRFFEPQALRAATEARARRQS